MRIVLVRPKNPENVGAAARAMKNFGHAELWLVAPRCRRDRRAYALASHAGDVLDAAREVDDLDAALAGTTWVLGTTARSRLDGFEIRAPRDGLGDLPDDGGALVFGPEDTGLERAELERCQGVLRIPTAAYASLNLAQAVNVVLYERFQQGAPPAGEGEAEEPPAPRETVEAMVAQLRGLLHRIGYTDAQRERAALHNFRRLFDRAALRPRDVDLLRGLLRQAAWAAEQPPERLPEVPPADPDEPPGGAQG